MPLDKPLRPPARRHLISKVTQKTPAKQANTVIDPWVDVAGDVAAVNAGRGTRVGNTVVVNERSYGVHDGTLYPIAGPGFHRLDRGAYKALGVYNAFGDSPRAAEILDMMGIGNDQRAAARAAWQAGRRAPP